jgi:DNA primase
MSPKYIEKVRRANPLKEVVEEYVDLHKSSSTLWCGRCPHPNHNDSTPSFRLVKNHDGWSWYCGGCHCGKKNLTGEDKNYGSDVFAFILWLNSSKGWKFPDAVHFLAKRANIPKEKNPYSAQYKLEEARANAYHNQLTKENIHYLTGRGLDLCDIIEWKLGDDNGRITFPLFGRYKSVLGFIKRSLNDNEPKYKNSPNTNWFNKSAYLYGLQNLDISLREIRITEGSFDVILGHKYGIKNLVATLGTSFTEEHIKIIKHLDMIPVFIFDGDSAGQGANRRAIELCKEHNLRCKVFELKDEDLAEFCLRKKKNLEQRIKNESIPSWKYIIRESELLWDREIANLQRKILPKVNTVIKMLTEEEKTYVFPRLLEKFGLIIQ